MARVLVTGADGFVGRAIVRRLRTAGHSVQEVTRARVGEEAVAIGDIATFAGWGEVTRGIDVVVHTAARAHVIADSVRDPLAEYRRVNVAPTKQLARAAADNGAQCFVFVSSIGVNGTTSIRPFTVRDVANPSEPYSISKWEAEQALLEVAATTSMQFTRVRTPLVIGAGAKGNLLRLLRLLGAGVPLPLGGIRNRRSFIDLEDLCDLLLACMFDRRAGAELFLAADDEILSTSELLRRMAANLPRSAPIFTVSPDLLSAAARVLGVHDTFERLASSLLVDASHARATLDWRPRRGLNAGIRDMTQAYYALGQR